MKKILFFLLCVALINSTELRAQEAGPTSGLPCGYVYTKMATDIYATPVAGSLKYRFSFYDNSTGELLTQFVQSSNKLTLASVPKLYYNTTYKWTVAVDKGNGFGSESDKDCLIAMGIPEAKLPCGM